MKYPFSTFLIVALLLNLTACQNQPLDTHAELEDDMLSHIDWQDQSGLMHCFPVSEQAFNRPIDSLSSPIAPDDNIWPRLQAGLHLSYVDKKQVEQQLNWYKTHPNYISRVQKRSSRYLYHIIEILNEYDIPLDIALLPIVESAYEPFAYSHGQASGLWQFIPMTGKRFRLHKDWWLDERRDTQQSTEAAAKYLKYLHRYFDGDWLLAIAAYNSGEGTVRRAIRKNKAQGKDTDFWSLDLPKETRAYVPKLLALSEIFRAPKKYGIKLLPIPNKAYYAEITLDAQLDLAQAAKLIDSPIEEIYYLNASLNRWATPPVKSFTFNVPIEKRQLLEQKLSQLPETQRINWHRHTIKSGESLSIIAQKYKSSTALIKQVNHMSSNTIVAGKTLMVPTASSGVDDYRFSQSQRNNKRKKTAPKNHKHKSYYQVKSGDSFWSISRKYKVSSQVLAKWNAKSPKDTLNIGEKLVIWHKKPQNTFERKATVRKLHYKVRSGDSLSRVASKFKVNIPQIVNWNKLNPEKYLYPGQALTLYVNVNETY